MSHIVTVLGEISPHELGFCQSHEHLWITKGQSALVNLDLCIDDGDCSRAELELYRQAGGRAVVDAQPVGCGRDAGLLEEISRQSGVHIIASTGFHKMLFYPEVHWVFTLDADRLTRIYIDELTRGMYANCDAGFPSQCLVCRAGQIKTALDAGAFTPQYQKLFQAAADAAVETDAPLMTHIEKGSDPVALADFLHKQRVALDRVIFCHMDRSVDDLGVHKELCQRGIYMEYDTVARPKYHDDNREAEIVMEMLETGWQERLLMSLDVTRARLRSYGGGVGLCYIQDTFLPLLRSKGVTGAQIQSIFVANPARVFAR